MVPDGGQVDESGARKRHGRRGMHGLTWTIIAMDKTVNCSTAVDTGQLKSRASLSAAVQLWYGCTSCDTETVCRIELWPCFIMLYDGLF